MKSIKWKLVCLYLGLVLIVMIVSGTFILLSTQSIEYTKAKSQLQTYAQIIEEQVVTSYDEASFQYGLEQFAKKSSDSSELQGNILDFNGNTLASTAVSQPPYPQYKNSVVISAISGVATFDKGDKNIDDYGSVSEWMSYARPVLINGEVKYIVFTQMDAKSVNITISQTRQTIVFSVLLALLLTAVMGYIFAKTLTDPILVLSSKAKELAEGNLDVKMEVASNDEIGQLSSSFNNMASELNKTMSVITKEKNKLEIILYNMSDGVLSFDVQGKLVHINTAAKEALEVDEFDYTLSEFIKEYSLNSGIYLDMVPGVTKTEVFPIDDKFINANFSPYVDEKGTLEGMVVVLQDITEQKKLDDMRKEFVANVSHELRTPLTTIKSYTETLIDGAIDEKEIAVDFLKIIDSEADRMAFLVRDLLQLSRFDNKQIKLNYSDFNACEFIKECIRQSKILAENKQQRLYFDEPNKDFIIHGDRDRINQVMNNILSNAIKYSLNQAEIKVTTEEDSEYYIIKVKDTGMGIQKEDLARIFERFYRVDKARSRAMGGTGLGLAIAKEIMESHGGKIIAQSEYGKGTTMILYFPKINEI